MSESKHEIPAPMLEAAAKAYLDNLLPEKFKADFDGENHTHRFTAYAQEMARLMLEAAGVAKMAARIAEMEANAERYRWLREQDWDTGPLAVVRDPKLVVKLGHDLPSRARLDEAIDAAMNAREVSE